jgi:peptidyl-prolyl cis-trans isomerase SurA
MNSRFFGAILIVCTFVSLNAHALLVDKIAAIVNNEVILQSDIDRFDRTFDLRQQLDPFFGISEDFQKGKPSRAKILDFLILERLIMQGYKVPDADVEQEIASVERDKSLDRTQVEGFLKSKGFNYNDYFELMRISLSKRNVLDREIRSRVNITDDDVRNYYFNKAEKDAKIPVEYSLQLILIASSSYKNQKAAQDTADRALRDIRQGESFADVARRVSDDPSAQNGGELGYIGADQLAEPLRSTARALQIGTVSNVIKTPNGFMIVKLIDMKSSESNEFQKVKEELRREMATKEYQKQIFIWAERARNDAYVHIN